jgi:hypothetical protein
MQIHLAAKMASVIHVAGLMPKIQLKRNVIGATIASLVLMVNVMPVLNQNRFKQRRKSVLSVNPRNALMPMAIVADNIPFS